MSYDMLIQLNALNAIHSSLFLSEKKEKEEEMGKADYGMILPVGLFDWLSEYSVLNSGALRSKPSLKILPDLHNAPFGSSPRTVSGLISTDPGSLILGRGGKIEKSKTSPRFPGQSKQTPSKWHKLVPFKAPIKNPTPWK
jgi:hypothetical protein